MDDPWDSPWATDGLSITTAPNEHDPNTERHQGFVSSKENEWESGEWSSDPWTRNADSAISLGENTSKLDSDQDIWTKHDDNEFKNPHEDVWDSEGGNAATVSPPIDGDVWHDKREGTITKNSLKETNGLTANKAEPESIIESALSPTDTLDVKKDAEKRLSKVQELVTMYNDMAAIKSSSDLGKESDISEESPQADLAGDGTAPIICESGESQFNSSKSVSEPEPKVPEQTHETKETYLRGRDIAIEEAQEAQLEPEPEPKVIEPNQGGLAYPVHLANLDELLPSTRPMPRPDIAIPDTLPADSFANISQRKAWYRMSRYGSSRKHDAGEGYSRVTWANSQVRTKTIQIVRRWMEQDSIAGRVVLGGKAGGAIGASLFNWDSNEPAVQIGELLKKRRDLDPVHTRVHSAPTREPVDKATEWPASVPATPAIGMFDQAAIPKSLWEEDTSQPPTPLFNMRETAATESRKPSPIMPPTPTPFAITQPQETDQKQDENDNEGGDDDDDWGEMVTSPTVQESRTFSSMMPSHQQPNSPDGKEAPTIKVSQPEPEPEADEWDFGGWASPSIEKISTPIIDTSKRVSLPVAKSTSPVVTTPFADDGGWGFGDMKSFDTGHDSTVSLVSTAKDEIKQPSTPLDNQIMKHKETLQPEKVNTEAVASALRHLPNLAYMLN